MVLYLIISMIELVKIKGIKNDQPKHTIYNFNFF